MLSSPVLWLNEGERDISISVTCEDRSQERLLNCDPKTLCKYDQHKLYSYDKQTLHRITDLFSEEAWSFLEKKYEEFQLSEESASENTIEDIDAFLSEPFANGGGFSEKEKRLLKVILADKDENYSLKEVPLSKLTGDLQNELDLVEGNVVELGCNIAGFIGALKINEETITDNHRKYHLVTHLLNVTYERGSFSFDQQITE